MTTSNQSYYALLGVSKDASTSQIKTAYRKLMLQHHPDRQGDVALVQKLNLAYETLKDPQKRKDYDRTHTALQTSQYLDDTINQLKSRAHLVKSSLWQTLAKGVHSTKQAFKPYNELTVYLKPHQALFGDTITLQTAHQSLQIAIPAFKNQITLIIKNAGKPILIDGNVSYGELHLTCVVGVPNLGQISDEEKKLWQQIRQLHI